MRHLEYCKRYLLAGSLVPDNHATPVTTQHLLNWRLRTAAHTTNQSRLFAWNSSLPATSLASTCSNSEYTKPRILDQDFTRKESPRWLSDPDLFNRQPVISPHGDASQLILTKHGIVRTYTTHCQSKSYLESLLCVLDFICIVIIKYSLFFPVYRKFGIAVLRI